MPGVLGCGTYHVELRQILRFDAAGALQPVRIARPLRLSGVWRGNYTRTFNAWGPAEIRVEGGSTCDNILSRVQPLLWEVRIMRGNVAAYSGPVLKLVQESGFRGVTIQCGDIVSWFAPDGGRMLNLVNMAYDDVDPVNIAADVIRRMIAMTDPPDNLLIADYIYTNTVGETIDYAPGRTCDYIIETLDDLTDYGLLYAAVGRRIILSSPATLARRPVAHLSTADITDGVEVITDGTDMAVLGVAVRDGDPPDAFIAGSWGTVWGTPMARVDVDEGVSDRTALNAARRATDGRKRPRVLLDMPDGAQLKPSAPIRFSDLRPGSAHVTFEVRDIPRPVKQSFMLTEVDVTFAGELEEVSISVSPIGEPTAL